DRIPGKYVAGKTIDTGDVPVNFVHRDDVVRIIYEMIRQQKWGELYNVAAPQHPVRREVYAQNVQDFGFAPPVYKDGPVPPHKVVNGEKLVRALNYTFLFPDPVTFRFCL
nr:SDR family NAD(P)-dependent oxidoreductase [Cytophagales bacterium]